MHMSFFKLNEKFIDIFILTSWVGDNTAKVMISLQVYFHST